MENFISCAVTFIQNPTSVSGIFQYLINTTLYKVAKMILDIHLSLTDSLFGNGFWLRAHILKKFLI